jgi:hypothetical protein
MASPDGGYAHGSFNDGTLTLPYSKDKVKDSPNVDISGGHLSQDEERRVYEYFGLAYSERRSDSGLPDGGTTGMTRGTTDFTDEDVDMGVGQDTSGPETDDAMTRSEEHVNVGTRSEDTGRARLRKCPGISEEDHEVTLREERPVIDKTTEPVERVRLGKEEISDEENVTEEVRKERIEAEGDVDDRNL